VFGQFSILTFIYTLPIPEGQTGDAWELSKGNAVRVSRNVGYENIFFHFFKSFKRLQEFSFPAISHPNYSNLGLTGLQ
jgi:hypothetical protein